MKIGHTRVGEMSKVLWDGGFNMSEIMAVTAAVMFGADHLDERLPEFKRQYGSQSLATLQDMVTTTDEEGG